jgi:hypothetical protein
VEYSNFAFLNTNLTFLRFHALVPSRFHLASPGRGVYSLENELKWDLSSPMSPAGGDGRAAINTMLDQRGQEWKQTSTFSKEGREYVVELREGLFPEFLWFPKHFAVDFIPDYTQTPRAGKRYISGSKYLLRIVTNDNSLVSADTQCVAPKTGLSPTGWNQMMSSYCHRKMVQWILTVTIAHSSSSSYTCISKSRNMLVC